MERNLPRTSGIGLALAAALLPSRGEALSLPLDVAARSGPLVDPDGGVIRGLVILILFAAAFAFVCYWLRGEGE